MIRQGMRGIEMGFVPMGEPLGSVQACARVVMIYSRRWKIEEFHMGLKTGCGVEDRQLETRKRMEAFLGLASVMSVMLLRMRDAARGRGRRPRFI